MRFYKIFATFAGLLSALAAFAVAPLPPAAPQPSVPDTVCTAASDTLPPTPCLRGWARFENSSLGQGLTAGVPLVAMGIVATAEDHHLRDWRNSYADGFHTGVDQYLRFAPAAALLGMKLGGLESATPWGQMLTADAAATVLMAGGVKAFKVVADRERPDGDGDDSFPSGHTAAAFMCATMLHHEYGEKYPWVSALGYGTAAATAYMRIGNNRHWLGDVLAGAGIGICATELGYLVSDLIFGKPVLGSRKDCFADRFDIVDHPSFVGVYLSYDTPCADLDVQGIRLKAEGGCSLGVEGAWYFSRNIGVGGIFSLGTHNLCCADGETLQPHPLKDASAMAGVYGSLPLSARFALGAKALGGFCNWHSMRVMTGETASALLPHRTVGRGCFGVSATFRVQPALAYRIFCDFVAEGARTSGTASHFSIGAQAAYTF